MLTSIQVQPPSQSPHPVSASAATFIPVTWDAIGHNCFNTWLVPQKHFLCFFASYRWDWDPQEQWKSDLKKAGKRWRQMGNLKKRKKFAKEIFVPFLCIFFYFFSFAVTFGAACDWLLVTCLHRSPQFDGTKNFQKSPLRAKARKVPEKSGIGLAWYSFSNSVNPAS